MSQFAHKYLNFINVEINIPSLDFQKHQGITYTAFTRGAENLLTTKMSPSLNENFSKLI